MDKRKNPHLTTPPLDHPDTLAALLEQIPAQILGKFPETVKYIEGVGAVQQSRMKQKDITLCARAAMCRAINGLDPDSPRSIAAMQRLLESEIYAHGTISSQENLVKLERQVEDFLIGSNMKSLSPTQAALPEKAGLTELVEFFKAKCQSRMRAAMADTPSLEGEDFIHACFKLRSYAATFNGLFNWSGGAAIYNVFGNFCVSNQATNILRSMVSDVNSTYGADSGTVKLEGLVEKIQLEEQRIQAQHAVASLSPEQTLRAVELLHKADGAAPVSKKSKPHSPR